MASPKRFKLSSDRKILIAGLACSLILLSFVIYAFMLPTPTQPIFPMWVVEPNGVIPTSGMNVTLGIPSGLLIGVQNQMGTIEYCSILVKFRDLSSPIPVSGNATVQSKASPLQPIMNFTFMLNNNGTRETPFNFNFLWQGNINSYTINSVVINNQTYTLTSPIQSGNLQNSSYQFLFELWTKNTTEVNYNFSGIWVSSPFLTINQSTSPTTTPEPSP